MTWPIFGNTTGDSNSVGPFVNSVVLVASFTTPDTVGTKGGNISAYEYQGQPTFRTAAIALAPCDFVGISGTQQGQHLVFYYTLNNPVAGVINLKPSTTYYLNVKNFAFGSPTCNAGATCSMRVEMTPTN
jgi:hypothetical protein